MNQTVISGNLTADIEIKEIQSANGDQHISKFTLACNEGDRVVFMPVEAWNMPHLADYLFKGSKALLSGFLKQENWETEAGDQRSRIVLTAQRVEFLDPAPERPSVESTSRARTARPGQTADRSGRSTVQRNQSPRRTAA